MNKSDSIELLAKALVQAQVEFKGVGFDSTNPYFKSKYASLGAVIETVKPVLGKYGLAVTQLVTGEGGQVGVETVLVHESGQWLGMNVGIPITDTKNVAQEAGKICTYIRRYALSAILGVYSEEDNDGERNTSQQPSKPVLETSRAIVEMGLEEAVEIKSSNGQLYAEMDIPMLVGILNGHQKKLKMLDLPIEERERIIRDDAAIKAIMQKKKG